MSGLKYTFNLVTGDREEDIFTAGEELLSERLFQNMDSIMRDFRDNPYVYRDGLTVKLHELVEKVMTAQETGRKGKLAYLCFSFLLSGLYTNTYEIKIDGYDDGYLKDFCETCVYWDTDFIFQSFEQDMEHFRKHIKTHIPRIQEYEVMMFRKQYAMHYYRITQKFIEDQIEEIILEIQQENLQLSDTLRVTFGGLYDTSLLLLEKEWSK